MKIRYFFIVTISFSQTNDIFASKNDLKDAHQESITHHISRESSLEKRYHSFLDSYGKRYDEITQKPVTIKSSKNKHKHYMRLCDFENDRTLELENLGKGLSLMTAIKHAPQENMSLDELRLYTKYGSSQQRLEVVKILIARDEIDEIFTWEFLEYPIPKLSAYDLYYGHMLLNLIDYAFFRSETHWAKSLLDVLREDLKSRLRTWFYGSGEYLTEMGYEYMDRMRRILNEKMFDGGGLDLDMNFLKDKQWRKFGRYSIELSKTQVETVSLMLEKTSLER